MEITNKYGDTFTFYSRVDDKNILVMTDDTDKFTLILTTMENFLNGMVFKPVRRSNDNRVGLTYLNNKKELMTIIKYNSSSDIFVKFIDDYGAVVHTTFNNFKRGEVNNPYRRSYYNKGYIGEGFKPSRDDKSMECWSNMLKRAYNEKFISLHPTYEDCEVCEEWLNFQNFHKWYLENFYIFRNQVMCLDKDILVKGNKIYSPNTAIFVPQFINKLFTRRDNNRGKYPIGVHKNNNRYIAECSVFDIDTNTSQILRLGSYETPEEAFYVYKGYKENYIREIADKYKEELPIRLIKAMEDYEVDIND